MILVQRFGTPVLLVLITLLVQCGGAAALILWIRSIPREIHGVRLFHCAALVMQTTIAVIVLHGIVILLWASCYRWICFPSWESAFYFSASSYATVGYGDVRPSIKVATVGPARKHGRHADVRSLHWSSIRGGHSSGRRRVTISSTTSLRTRGCGSHRSATKSEAVIRSVALEGHDSEEQFTVSTGLPAWRTTS